MTRTEMDAYLPGDPSRLLVSKVRSALKFYGIVPTNSGRWSLAWSWAAEVMKSYGRSHLMAGMMKEYRKKHWPAAGEIAAQYMAILLADMRDGCSLKLPYRSAECLPVPVAVRLADVNVLALVGRSAPTPALPAPPTTTEE